MANDRLPKNKERLDLLLVERGLYASRQIAQRSIQAGLVKVGDRVIDKVGTPIPRDAEITVTAVSRFVSRGGDKLAKALADFDIAVAGRVCLDGGISTGGFTDCLLQSGAKLVYGIDVGYGQVDWKIRSDDRTVIRERTNLRHLTSEELYKPTDIFPSLAVVDVSFISLSKVLPSLTQLLDRPAEAILLIKPQFEVGKELVGKNGVVRQPSAHVTAIKGTIDAAKALHWEVAGLTYSPITGPAGNIEYLLWLKTNLSDPIDLDIGKIVNTANEALQGN
jgi:23S rRNA (cytidine1920-2'-O)/16S rRNA (cytidine1409-2'-O)-methyltransferase